MSALPTALSLGAPVVSAATALRILCGAFFIPHAIGKLTARDAAYGFFRKAGFNPAEVFVPIALGLEAVFAVMLIGGFFVEASGAAACVYLLVATAAVLKVDRRWLWHLGGCEYPLFWALGCAIAAFLR